MRGERAASTGWRRAGHVPNLTDVPDSTPPPTSSIRRLYRLYHRYGRVGLGRFTRQPQDN